MHHIFKVSPVTNLVGIFEFIFTVLKQFLNQKEHIYTKKIKAKKKKLCVKD